jgi:sulfate permease
MELLIIIIALLFAANIGASGSAAAMGEVYGAGAIRKRTLALALVAVGIFLGSIIAGGEVVRTLGGGLVPSEHFSLSVAAIALVAALAPLAIANLLGIPLSTSEVTVGALVGIGAALGVFNLSLLLLIVASWTLLPLAAFLLTSGGTWSLQRTLGRDWRPRNGTVGAFLLTGLLITGGIYTAFSAGANNTANAIAPLVASGIMASSTGLLLGGVAIALGAFFLGHRVLETNGKRIAKLELTTGSLVTFTTGTLVLVASMFGIPVPLTQATSGAIMGVGFAREGRKALHGQVVRDIATVWVLSPLLSIGISYSAMHILLGLNPFTRPMTYVLALVTLAGMAVTGGLLNRARAQQGLLRLKVRGRAFARVTDDSNPQ